MCFNRRQWTCLPEGCSVIHTNVRLPCKTPSVKGFTRDGGLTTAQMEEFSAKICSSTHGDLSWLKQLPAIWVPPDQVWLLHLHACYLTEQLSPQQPGILMSPNCKGFACLFHCKTDFTIPVHRLGLQTNVRLGSWQEALWPCMNWCLVDWCHWRAACFTISI